MAHEYLAKDAWPKRVKIPQQSRGSSKPTAAKSRANSKSSSWSSWSACATERPMAFVASVSRSSSPPSPTMRMKTFSIDARSTRNLRGNQPVESGCHGDTRSRRRRDRDAEVLISTQPGTIGRPAAPARRRPRGTQRRASGAARPAARRSRRPRRARRARSRSPPPRVWTGDTRRALVRGLRSRGMRRARSPTRTDLSSAADCRRSGTGLSGN